VVEFEERKARPGVKESDCISLTIHSILDDGTLQAAQGLSKRCVHVARGTAECGKRINDT
jgi:hypothetical protein